ncbi:hypothetical protein CLOM_g13007 [Closterium sp. NIES-68]|nr:hypothetical protein CLOM_g13007 [Closterium sp. NIES-68]
MSPFHALRSRLQNSHSQDSLSLSCGKRAIQNLVFRGPVFAVLLALWLLAGVSFAAWLCYSTHASYQRDRRQRLDTWCYERAKLFEQLTLTTISQIRTLAGLAAVMGRPRGHGNWTWDTCLTEERWTAHLNGTSYSRPGNTGAMVCLYVTDQERPAFERQYGGPILDFTLARRQQAALYCPKVLEIHAYRGVILLVDIMQRAPDEMAFLRASGDIVFSPVAPIGPLALNLTGFAVGVPILQHALPPGGSEQQVGGAAVGAAGANVDLTSIAASVLHKVFTPDPSITFEVYDSTSPRGMAMIYGPGPQLLYYKDRDILPLTDISPDNVTRPLEQHAVVPLDLLGGRLRRYEVWCRYVQPSSAWLSWGVPVLWTALALVVTALIAGIAWQQRVGYVRSQEGVAAADVLRGQARAAEQSKSAFVASMSHELRTPMVGIMGMLDALADMGLSAAQLADVGEASVAAQETVRLVNRVLDLSKLEAGRMALSCSRFYPRAWLEKLVLQHYGRARHKGIEMGAMVDTSVPAVLDMDTMRLTQALNELIDNALCYTTRGHVLLRACVCAAQTALEDAVRHLNASDAPRQPPPPPRPSLSWLSCVAAQPALLFGRAVGTWWEEQGAGDESDGGEDRPVAGDAEAGAAAQGEEERARECGGGGWRSSEGMQLVVACEDTGCGFQATWEDLSHFQGRSESGGAGLGLVLVHQLVSLMGGRVACLSRPGAGSTVAFSVPFSLRPHSPCSPTAHADPPPHEEGEAEEREEDGTDEDEERAGQTRGCGAILGGWVAKGVRGCRGRARRGMQVQRCGAQGMREKEPWGEEEAVAGVRCASGIEGVAVAVVGAHGDTRELTARMLSGLGARVRLLPHALRLPAASAACGGEEEAGGLAGCGGPSDRAQEGMGDCSEAACRESGSSRHKGGGTRGAELEGGGEGYGEGRGREWLRGSMACVVVVEEEDVWRQHGGGAACVVPSTSDHGTGGGDHCCAGDAQHGALGGVGRRAGVVALVAAEAAAWQAAVGLARHSMAGMTGPAGGGRGWAGTEVEGGEAGGKEGPAESGQHGVEGQRGRRWCEGDGGGESGVDEGMLAGRARRAGASDVCLGVGKEHIEWCTEGRGEGRGSSPTVGGGREASQPCCRDEVAGIVILAVSKGDEDTGMEESSSARGGRAEEEQCADVGGAVGGTRASSAPPSPPACPSSPLTASVPASAAPPRVVVCHRPLLSHRLCHAIQLAAFGLDYKDPSDGSARCERHGSPDSAWCTEQSGQQDGREGGCEEVHASQCWCMERSGQQQQCSSGAGMVADAGVGMGGRDDIEPGWMSECDSDDHSVRHAVRSVSVHVGAMAGGTNCSSTTRRHSSSGAEAAAAATAAAVAAAGVLQGRRILVVDDTAVNLLVARRTLTRCGATVTTAGSGEDAVRRVAAALSAAGDARGVMRVVRWTWCSWTCTCQAWTGSWRQRPYESVRKP